MGRHTRGGRRFDGKPLDPPKDTWLLNLPRGGIYKPSPCCDGKCAGAGEEAEERAEELARQRQAAAQKEGRT